MWAYVDETGNTGNRIFDDEQPMFITAAMMTRTNFDLLRSRSVARIAAGVGVKALHANELGARRVQNVSSDLLAILKSADARFFVSRLEKRYLAAAKVVDTYFDAGENLAVPWHVYWLKQLRLTLTFNLAAFVLTEEIAQTVWSCLTAPSEPKSKALFLEGAGLILARVEKLPDVRTRQIVSESLEWAIANSENFSTHIRDKISRYGHSPNFVAFTNLLDGLERTSKKWGRPIKEIVHDQQSQFEKTLSQWHEVVSRPDLADVEPVHWPGETEPMTVSKVAGSKFRMATEESSAGLQVVDIVLWLFKRAIDGKSLDPESARLLNWVLGRAFQHDFSFVGVGEQAEQAMHRIMNAEMTEKQTSDGAKMLADNEAHRQKAMDEYRRQKLIGL